MEQNKYKSGFATIVGRPNVGKSTLMNTLIGQKIAITSDKPQTTRNTIKGVLTEDRFQIIFIDTPGIHKPKHKLGQLMVQMARNTLREVDCILFVVDGSKKPSSGEGLIAEMLEGIETPVILVVNKIDLAKGNIYTPEYVKLYPFSHVVEVAAINGRNLGVLKEILNLLLPEGPQYYPPDMVTDQPERLIVAEIIREKILKKTHQEIPHGVAVELLSMEDKGKFIEIQGEIICEKDTHKGIIIGKQGQLLKEIGQQARIDMENLLGTKVFLELWVKVRKDWRNKEIYLKSLGFKD
jgi:GTP-binding protein Era